MTEAEISSMAKNAAIAKAKRINNEFQPLNSESKVDMIHTVTSPT
jgi:hypothetical protein